MLSLPGPGPCPPEPEWWAGILREERLRREVSIERMAKAIHLAHVRDGSLPWDNEDPIVQSEYRRLATAAYEAV